MKIRRLIMPFIFCLYLAGVALMCFLHAEQLPNITGMWFGLPADKVVHAGMFLPFIPLAFFTFRSRKASAGGINLLILTILMLAGIGIAYMTEVIQEELGYRRYDKMDFLANCVGLCVGFICIAAGIIINKIRNKC